MLHETNGCSMARQIIAQRCWIFICGKPGTGKTRIGKHLQKHLKEKIETIEQVYVKSLAEVLPNIDMEKNQFFFLDDVFGSLVPNDGVYQWLNHLAFICQKLQEKANVNHFKTYVIFTSRTTMLPLHSRKYCDIDLDDSEYVLNYTDKKSILNIVRNTENTEYEQLKNVNTHDDIGFPLCAYIHAHFFEHLEVSDFFVKPIKHILQSANSCFEDTELRKVFYVMAMNNGRICKHFLSLNIGALSFKHDEEVYFHYLNKQCASFTRTVNNGYIEFIHCEVLEEVERIFILNCPNEAIQYVSFKAISNTVFLQRGTERLDSRLYLHPTDSMIDTLLSRLFESVCKGNIFQPCNFDILGHEVVCEKFKHILNMKRTRCLERFFSSEDTYHGNRVIYWTAKLHQRDFSKLLIEFLKLRSLENIDTSELLGEALIGACSIAQLELVEYIIECGANVSYCRGCVGELNESEDIPCQDCPIETACRSQNKEAIKCLLKNEAIIPHSGWKYWNIFHNALKYGEVENVLAFVQSLCQSNDEGNITCTRDTALDAANWENIHHIFYTFVAYDLVTTPMLRAFFDLDVNLNYRGNDGSFVLFYFLKHFEHKQTQSSFDAIVMCLERGANPNHIDSNDKSALVVALRMQPLCLQLLEVLLQYEANPDIRGSDGSNCLHVCVCTNLEDGHMKYVLSKLVENGADRSARTHHQLSPVQLLVKVQTNPEEYFESLQYLSENCLTEILNFRLSKKKASEIVFNLIDRGYDVQKTGEKAETCLSLAISFYPSIVRRLLKSGADHTCLDGNGRTMIERALLSDNKSISSVLDDLLEFGHASVDCSPKYFVSAFISKHNRYKEICNLLQRFPSTAIKLKDNSCQTFLHLSVSSILSDDNVLDLAKKFKGYGGHFDNVDCHNICALDLAARSRILRSKTILYLIQQTRVDIVQVDFLLKCCTNSHLTIQILETLNSRQMLPKLVSKNRQILHVLAANTEILPHNYNSIVKILVKSIVTFKLLDVCNQDNNTVLHVAAKCGNLSMVTTLCNHAINVNYQNKLGNTALHELIAEQSIEDINARNICSEIVKVVKPKFNWSLRNNQNMTVIEILFSNIDKSCSRKKTLEFILSTCKNVNETFKEKSILHYALNMDKSDYYVSQLVDLILLHSPSLDDVTDNCKRTALNAAARNKQYCRIRSMLQLLMKGADPNTVDNIQQNPLMNSIKSPRGHKILSEAERLFRVVILLIFECDKNKQSLEEETPYTVSNDYKDIINFLSMESTKSRDALELVKLKSKTIIENLSKTKDCPPLDLGLVSSSNTLNQCFHYIAEAYPYMAAKPLAYDVYGVKAQVPVTDDFMYERGSQNQTNDSTDESDDDSDAFIPEESVAIRNI